MEIALGNGPVISSISRYLIRLRDRFHGCQISSTQTYTISFFSIHCQRISKLVRATEVHWNLEVAVALLFLPALILSSLPSLRNYPYMPKKRQSQSLLTKPASTAPAALSSVRAGTSQNGERASNVNNLLQQLRISQRTVCGPMF